MCIAVGVYVNVFQDSRLPALVLVIPALLFVFPVRADLRQRFTKVSLAGDKLHYQSGMFSRMTRTIQLSKVQDVRVDQTFGQRLMGVGDLSIETAGDSSRLTIENIDDPQAVADVLTGGSR
jgi:uncharacterized membrane protein YdbT with pleckstrin-like domain